MKKAEVSKFISSGVKNNLGDDFKKMKNNHYLKHFGELYFDFGFGIVDSDRSFSSTFNCAFGSNQYSNLLNHLIEILELNYQQSQYLFCYGFNQLRLFDEGKYPILEYDIYTEADAQKMVDEVSDYILNTILPEWEANPTTLYLEKKVNEKLNDNPNFSGLILAKLVGSSNYDSVKSHYANMSKNWNNWDKQELEKVITFLDCHSQDKLRQIAETT